jgi:hypothetical protein
MMKMSKWVMKLCEKAVVVAGILGYLRYIETVSE